MTRELPSSPVNRSKAQARIAVILHRNKPPAVRLVCLVASIVLMLCFVLGLASGFESPIELGICMPAMVLGLAEIWTTASNEPRFTSPEDRELLRAALNRKK